MGEPQVKHWWFLSVSPNFLLDIFLISRKENLVTYHIYRPKNSDTTCGISIREDGAMLYHSGLGFGIFYEGKFTSQDLDLIVKMDIELAKRNCPSI
jgi:hypothetical protein